MKIAYGRVSAKDQNFDRQLIKFAELGVEERFVFTDKQSGKRNIHREDDERWMSKQKRFSKKFELCARK
ncbi:recombinase family protein [Paenibacillus medicaginis]|uniref:Recombinase family protein n=1 Tax=Paenibacillus medicaginis TaxID=1470560 RepID=A0ABV5C3H5_9BACL